LSLFTHFRFFCLTRSFVWLYPIWIAGSSRTASRATRKLGKVSVTDSLDCDLVQAWQAWVEVDEMSPAHLVNDAPPLGKGAKMEAAWCVHAGM
jgi:hypothetical protein